MAIRERKYEVEPNNARLVKRDNGVAIPEDEPLFILRAKDVNAVDAISFYCGLCKDLNHRAAVMKAVEDFKIYADAHPNKMDSPDT